jgi:hypothetical protein
MLLPLLLLLQFLFSAAVQTSVRTSVIVLDSQRDQFESFVRVWSVWPELNAQLYRAVRNDKRRGEGLCQSVLAVLQRDEGNSPNMPSLIFAPDALPFPGVNYSAASILHATSDISFLGGHFVKYDPAAFNAYWTPIHELFGTYGMAFSPHGRRKIVPKLALYCASNRTAISVDIFLSACFDAVLATPLLVDHPSQGFSTTWKQYRKWDFAGNRFWWRLKNPTWSAANDTVDHEVCR